MIEEGDVGRVLSGDTFTNRAMAGVVVYRVIIRMRMYMLTSACVLVRHLNVPLWFVIGRTSVRTALSKVQRDGDITGFKI